MGKIVSQIKKHSKGIYLGLVYVFLLAILLAGFIRVVLPAAQRTNDLLINMSSEEEINIEDLEDGWEQKISGINGDIEKIEIPFICKKVNKNSKIKIVLSKNNKEVATAYCRFSDENMEMFEFPLSEAVPVDNNSEVQLTFIDEGDYVEGTGAVKKAKYNIPQIRAYTSLGTESENEICLKISGGTSQYVFVYWGILVACLSLIYLVLCYGILKKEWKIEQYFLVLGSGIGILYAVFWGPYSCPDEYAHISTAYYYSSEMLNQPSLSDKGEVLVREEDMYYTPEEAFTRRYSYYLYNNWNIGDMVDTKNVIKLDRGPLTVPFTSYLPQIIAITFIRLLGGENVAWLLLGRVFALSVYLALGYIAIKIIPFAKRAITVLLLAPTSMQVAASFSYDCMLNACSLLFVAYVLFLAYEKKSVSLKDWVILILSSVIMSPIKVIYLALVFLVFLIPNNKMNRNNVKALMSKIALLATNLLAVLVSRITSITNLIGSSEYNNTTGEIVKGYDLETIIRNPLKVIVLWVNTIRVKTVDYLRHTFGGVETANGIHISWLIISLFLVLVVLALIVEKNEKLIDFKGKIVSLGICVVLFGALLLTFTLSTDLVTLKSAYIIGIQGRYFLPFLPLVFIGLQGKTILAKHSIQIQLIVAVYFLQFLTICTIFETAVGR